MLMNQLKVSSPGREPCVFPRCCVRLQQGLAAEPETCMPDAGVNGDSDYTRGGRTTRGTDLSKELQWVDKVRSR